MLQSDRKKSLIYKCLVTDFSINIIFSKCLHVEFSCEFGVVEIRYFVLTPVFGGGVTFLIRFTQMWPRPRDVSIVYTEPVFSVHQ